MPCKEVSSTQRNHPGGCITYLRSVFEGVPNIGGKDFYMKRIVSVIMAGLLMIACTNTTVFAQEQKYEELIRYLDEGDYDAAHEYIDKLQEAGNLQESETDITMSDPSQASSGEDIMEIELTPDNFKDYFDIVFSDTETNLNEFDGEISNYSNTYIFVNNAYNDGMVFLGTSTDFAVEIDLQYLEGSFEKNSEVVFFFFFLKSPCSFIIHNDSKDISLKDYSVSRVKGTVFFAKEEAVDSFKRFEETVQVEGYETYVATTSFNGDEVWAINFVKTINQ